MKDVQVSINPDTLRWQHHLPNCGRAAFPLNLVTCNETKVLDAFRKHAFSNRFHRTFTKYISQKGSSVRYHTLKKNSTTTHAVS
jgi:hypothetical protein